MKKTEGRKKKKNRKGVGVREGGRGKGRRE